MKFSGNFFFLPGMKCTPSMKIIYDDTNGKAEKISRVLYIALVKVFPQLSIWPKFIVSFVNYLTTDSTMTTYNGNTSIDIDLKSEIFQLPTPMW